jgi:hypothetical protein
MTGRLRDDGRCTLHFGAACELAVGIETVDLLLVVFIEGSVRCVFTRDRLTPPTTCSATLRAAEVKLLYGHNANNTSLFGSRTLVPEDQVSSPENVVSSPVLTIRFRRAIVRSVVQ